MQSMPKSEILKGRGGGAKVTPCCPNSSRDSKNNWRLLKCRFEVLFLILFWVLQRYCEKVVVQYLIQTCTTR
ncbi:hypothetical protein FKM82_005961 [Ascaphus truei]